jgi:hypothetical protein
MQRNLVYVIGLSASMAKEDLLKQRQYFGRFGRIVKVAVNKKQVHIQPRASLFVVLYLQPLTRYCFALSAAPVLSEYVSICVASCLVITIPVFPA